MSRPRGSFKSLRTYCHHKGRDLAYVTLGGKEIYLGRYDTNESRAEYDRVVGEWMAAGRTAAPYSRGGGTSDTLSGGAGFDTFWADNASTEIVGYGDGFADMFIEGLAKSVHRI